MGLTLLVLLIAGLLTFAPAWGDVLRVPGDFVTISEALANVTTSDTILVAPGVYAGVEYIGHGNSPQNVTLMGSGWPSGTVLVECTSCSEPSVLYLRNLRGWRITNLEMQWASYGPRLIDMSSCEVDHNYIHDIIGGPGWANPIIVFGEVTDTDIHHNLVAHCFAGIFVGWEGLSGYTHNVRIYNNTIVATHGYHPAIQFRAQTPTGSLVANNIIWQCDDQGVEMAGCEQNDTEISYNCISMTNGAWENVWPGPGNIYGDPQFALGSPIPFHLTAESPCIDAGHPDLPYDPDGTRSDMGAFYYSQLNAPDIRAVEREFALLPNYPNPFNPSTTVRFSVPKLSRVTLSIYDILGRRVTTLAEGLYSPGPHELVWNCAECPTGVYVLQINSEGAVQQRKMLLVK